MDKKIISTLPYSDSPEALSKFNKNAGEMRILREVLEDGTVSGVKRSPEKIIEAGEAVVKIMQSQKFTLEEVNLFLGYVKLSVQYGYRIDGNYLDGNSSL